MAYLPTVTLPHLEQATTLSPRPSRVSSLVLTPTDTHQETLSYQREIGHHCALWVKPTCYKCVIMAAPLQGPEHMWVQDSTLFYHVMVPFNRFARWWYLVGFFVRPQECHWTQEWLRQQPLYRRNCQRTNAPSYTLATRWFHQSMDQEWRLRVHSLDQAETTSEQWEVFRIGRFREMVARAEC